MKTLHMIIDGKEIQAEEGATLLQVARKEGISIPTLCEHHELSPYGACRLCSVEIVKGGRTKVVASCVYPAEEGLVVNTATPRIQKIRVIILELLLASSPKGEVEKLAAEYGADSGKFAKELTFCILCGLCVRYCQEVKGEGALGFIGRGVERQVVYYPHLAKESCLKCDQKCVSLCPTCILPNIFGLAIPAFDKTYPTVYPVRLLDENNLFNLSNTIK
ncbi:MAG: 2Fe-2S iron-sulfur cluster-binding protein [Bacillota bacterium]|nr:2Fe-2S iron-sulfur cluster-binding protein [Bacillota bacterium]